MATNTAVNNTTNEVKISISSRNILQFKKINIELKPEEIIKMTNSFQKVAAVIPII